MTKKRLTVPMLGESIIEAEVARWLKRPGELVREGEPLLEVNTDKVTVEIPALASGVLSDFSVKEGDVVPIGGLLAFIDEDATARPVAQLEPTPTTPSKSPPVAPEAGGRHVVVVGGGASGFAAAMRLAQLGHRVELVERAATPGGRAVRGGSITRHALLAEGVAHRASSLPFHRTPPPITPEKWGRIGARARDVESRFRAAHVALAKVRGVVVHHGTGRVGPGRHVAVLDAAGVVREEMDPDHVVVATGTEPFVPSGVGVDGERILLDVDALELPDIPHRLLVIADDPTGFEWAMAFADLGALVTVVTSRQAPFPALDEDVALGVMGWIERRHVRLLSGVSVVGTVLTDRGVSTTLAPGQYRSTFELEHERVLLAAARRRPTGLPATEAGVELLGSCAHASLRASMDAIDLAERVAGRTYPTLPRSTAEALRLGSIEIAWVGPNEADLLRDGIPHRSGSAPFAANVAASAADAAEGSVKLLVHAGSDRVLGAQIWGPSAGELIGEMALAISMGASGDELARTPRPPGSLAEVLSEAARSAAGWPLMLAR